MKKMELPQADSDAREVQPPNAECAQGKGHSSAAEIMVSHFFGGALKLETHRIAHFPESQTVILKYLKTH